MFKSYQLFFDDLEISGSARGIQPKLCEIIPSPAPRTLFHPEQRYDPREAMPTNLVDITRTAKPFHFYLGAVLMEATFRNLVKQLHHSLMQEH